MREITKNLLLLFVVLFILFFTFEIYIRSTGYIVIVKETQPLGLTRFSESLGYELTPDFSGYFPTPYTDIPINISSKGTRSTEYSYYKSNNVTRLLFLGDSVTFGSGVRVEDLFLNNLDSRFESINTGVAGYNLDQEKKYYLDEGYKYNSDIVIYDLVLNDFEITNISLIKSYFDNWGFERKGDPKYRRTFKHLCHSCVFTYGALFNFNNIYANYTIDNWNNEKVYENYKNEILELNNKVKEQNKQFVIIIFPNTWQFENFKYGYKQPKIPQEKIMKLCKDNNIICLDLLPYLDKFDYEDYYLKADNVHLSSKGNKYISEIINNFLLKL
jgi:hypothetical protein